MKHVLHAFLVRIGFIICRGIGKCVVVIKEKDAPLEASKKYHQKQFNAFDDIK